MGYQSADEYLAGARSLLNQAAGGRAELWLRGADQIAVNPLTNQVAIYSTKGGFIRTFFSPNDEYAYIARHAEEWLELIIG